MAHIYREVRQSSVKDADLVDGDANYGATVIARIVSLIGGIITSVLAIRFVLSLLAANRANAFASFIYTISQPFVAPFHGLFNIQEQVGAFRFEFETLIAIAFWGFVTWMIVHLVTIGTRD